MQVLEPRPQPQHQQQQQQQPHRSKTRCGRPMTKLPGVTSSHGTTTTLINRSGQCYQLHRPHLGLASHELASGCTEAQQQQHQQQQQQQQPPHKKLKLAPGSGLGQEQQLSAKQQQQKQQALATNVLLHSLQAEQPLQLGSPHHVLGEHNRQLQLQQHGHTRHARHRHSQLQLQQRQQQQQPAPVSTHVSSLYPEILAQVFSNLDVRDRGRAAQVCVAWREAAYHRSAWRGVQAKLHLRKHSSQVFQCLERRGIRRVQVLSVTTRRSSLGDVFRGIPKLQSLNLSGCMHMSDSSLNNAIASSYPQLTELDLSNCKNLTDASLNKVGQYLGNLQALNLSGCGNITNNGLQLIAWGLKSLRRLELRSCWLISDQGIGFLAGLGANGDGSSSLPGSGNAGGNPSAGCHKLEHLGLQDCQRVSDDALRHLSQGLSSSLGSINLSFCVLITDAGMKHVAKIASLRHLDLRSCDNISEIGIAYLAEGGSRISSLDVSFCDKIGDQALQHISQGLFALKSLSMAACPISDEGICRIAKTQQELETLHIGQCSKLTDKAIISVADNMRHLRCIDLYGCTKLTRHSLDRFELKSPPICLNRDLWLGRR